MKRVNFAKCFILTRNDQNKMLNDRSMLAWGLRKAVEITGRGACEARIVRQSPTNEYRRPGPVVYRHSIQRSSGHRGHSKPSADSAKH